MAYDTSISLPWYMSTYDLPSPGMLPNIQRTAVTGYNRNSIIGYNTNSNCSSACRTFTLPAPNYSIVFIQHIRNVSIFNMYIYEKIHKINNSIDNLSKHLGGNTYSYESLPASLPASYDASLKVLNQAIVKLIRGSINVCNASQDLEVSIYSIA